MFRLNQLIMILLFGLLLWAVQHVLLPPIISLLINFIILIALIIYIMQFFGFISILPAPNLFK